MLADTVEAAVRSMPDPTPQGIQENIERLLRGKIEDGQLSETPMTLADVERATEAFLTVLSGVFHQRVEYPEMKIPPKKDRGHHEKADEAEKEPQNA